MKPMFWIIWCVDGCGPAAKHDNFTTACAEAKCLARENPDRTFAVCISVASYRKRDLEEISYIESLDLLGVEVPF